MIKYIVAVLFVLLAQQPPVQRPLSAIADDLDALSAELRNRPVVYQVHAGDSVSVAIALSKPGDTIVLDAGVKYTEPLTLTAKTGTGYVTITSSAVLPSRQITQDDAALLPTLASGNGGPAILGIGAANWRIDGVQFESTGTGAGEVITLQDASNIYLDRILLVAGVNGQKRAIRGNGTNITLTRSHIANIWAAGQDSQAFCAWDGAGPYTLTNNFLEAASENVMFGGADSKSADRVPSNILISGNLFTKRLEWKPVPPAKTSGKVVKNLLELKSAKHVTITGNVFERSWTDAQTGYAISLKSVNQGGTAPWSATEDVLFTDNVVRDAENGINIQGYAADQPGGRTSDIVILSNTVQTAGVGVQITGGPISVTLDHTTFVNGYTFLQLSGVPIGVLTVTNTLANHNAYGVKGDGTGIGTPSLTKFSTIYNWSNNVLQGGAGKGTYPPTTYFDMASVPANVVIGK